MQERIRGYKEAMKDNHLEEQIDIREIRYEFANEDIKKTINQIVSKNARSALLFATNAISIAGLCEIRESGIKVPEQLAIVGFDGHEVFDFHSPQLTYIKQPLEEMGKESVNLLIDKIKGSKKTVQVELESQLIIRESC